MYVSRISFVHYDTLQQITTHCHNTAPDVLERSYTVSSSLVFTFTVEPLHLHLAMAERSEFRRICTCIGTVGS